MIKLRYVFLFILMFLLSACGILGEGIEKKLNTEEGFYYYDEEEKFLTIFHFDVEKGEGTVEMTEYQVNDDGEEVVIKEEVDEFPVAIEKKDIILTILMPITVQLDGDNLVIDNFFDESEVVFKKGDKSEIDKKLAVLEEIKDELAAVREKERREAKKEEISNPIYTITDSIFYVETAVDQLATTEQNYDVADDYFTKAKQLLDDEFDEPIDEPRCYASRLDDVSAYYCEMVVGLNGMIEHGDYIVREIDTATSSLDIIEENLEVYNDIVEEFPDLKDDEVEGIIGQLDEYNSQKQEWENLQNEMESNIRDLEARTIELEEKYIK